MRTDSQPATVLALDPHRELVDMAGEILAGAGYRVLIAERFETAMSAMDAHPEISLAVCHATLKYGSSIQEFPILGVLAKRHDMGLVLISARPFEDIPNIPERAVRLAKPFGARELLEALAAAAMEQASMGAAP